MSFPSKTTQRTLRGLLDHVQDQAGNIRQTSLSARNAMAAGNVSGNRLVSLHAEAVRIKTIFDQAAANGALVQVAKDEFDDQGFDIVAEFNAMTAALSDVIANLEADFPTSPGGWLQLAQWDSLNGGVSVRSFTPTQTVALQSLLTTLAATIS